MIGASPEELDTAVRNGTLLLTRRNHRATRCANRACRALVPPGQGRRLWIERHHRGYLCKQCQR